MDLLRPIAPAYRAATVAVAASAAAARRRARGLSRAGRGDEASLDAPRVHRDARPGGRSPRPPPALPPAPKPRARAAQGPRPAPGRRWPSFPAAPRSAARPRAAAEDGAGRRRPRSSRSRSPPSSSRPRRLPAFRPDELPRGTDHRLLAHLRLRRRAGRVHVEARRRPLRDHRQRAGDRLLHALPRGPASTRSATGRVTPEGLQPERFTERRGDDARGRPRLRLGRRAGRVPARRQPAHRPPHRLDRRLALDDLPAGPPAPERRVDGASRVYTQRRLYEYRLAGRWASEDLELPFGRARTLHLRHTGEKPEEAVDVWLGVDQHYLPVKLRYPVARNRLMVEQTATSVRAR